MTSYFLDTSFLIDLIDAREDALSLHEEIAGAETTGTICVYELAKFAEFDPDELLAGKDVRQFTSEDAEAAGALHRELAAEGTPIGAVDTQIAGMARNRDLTLVTRDDHFREVDDLETRYY